MLADRSEENRSLPLLKTAHLYSLPLCLAMGDVEGVALFGLSH